MANIGLPDIDIIFKGLGVSAFKRGQKGIAVLIIKDDTNKNFTFIEYKSIDDLTTDEIAKFTTENVQYIKDVLEGNPLNLIIARMDTDGTLSDLLKILKGRIPMNCWIGIADPATTETNDLITWIKSVNQNEKKRFKNLAYKATTSDETHVVNFTNEKVVFNDNRGEQTGDKAVPYLLGFLAGLSLDISAIAKVLQKFKSVTEPNDLEAAVNKGEFVLMNDEGEVVVARSVNSLTTTGQDITDDFKYILITEVMDLIYTDIYTTWKKNYKGKYKNYLDNQMLLIGAINAYFGGLEEALLLDPNFENKTTIDVNQQRLANIPKYGKETVDSWDNDKVMSMTVGTEVFLKGYIKILNAMEDLKLEIFI